MKGWKMTWTCEQYRLIYYIQVNCLSPGTSETFTASMYVMIQMKRGPSLLFITILLWKGYCPSFLDGILPLSSGWDIAIPLQMGFCPSPLDGILPLPSGSDISTLFCIVYWHPLWMGYCHCPLDGMFPLPSGWDIATRLLHEILPLPSGWALVTPLWMGSGHSPLDGLWPLPPGWALVTPL